RLSRLFDEFFISRNSFGRFLIGEKHARDFTLLFLHSLYTLHGLRAEWPWPRLPCQGNAHKTARLIVIVFLKFTKVLPLCLGVICVVEGFLVSTVNKPPNFM